MYIIFLSFFPIVDQIGVFAQINQQVPLVINIIRGTFNHDIKTPYNPPSVNVPAGSAIKWINNDNSLHTVTSFTKAFDSGILQPNQEFGSPFYYSGIYKYYCQLYPYMNGAVIVN